MVPSRLREIRLKHGVSQLELARRSKIAPATISAIENSRQYPFSGWRQRLAQALGVPEQEIFPEKEVLDCGGQGNIDG